MVGTSSTTIAIVAVDATQGAFEIVHEKIFVPTASPVMDVVGDNEFVITPVPETKLHVPIPTVAEFALIVVVGVVIQSV